MTNCLKNIYIIVLMQKCMRSDYDVYNNNNSRKQEIKNKK